TFIGVSVAHVRNLIRASDRFKDLGVLERIQRRLQEQATAQASASAGRAGRARQAKGFVGSAEEAEKFRDAVARLADKLWNLKRRKIESFFSKAELERMADKQVDLL